jgi:hypothetical protein
MTKLSFQKLSILGLVLMGASAVTAAILPKSNSNGKLFANGHLFANSTGGSGAALNTCKAAGTEAVNCDFTATAGVASYTTDGSGTSTDAANGSTGALNTGLIGSFAVSR